jgi:N-acetylmuramic acid 6-phosphate etherase
MDGREADRIRQIPRVLLLSGTGSCCFGRAWDGRTAKVGGWGHILGDKGSAFEIGLRGLKAVVYYHDRDGEWSELGQRILRTLMLNEPNDLIDWVLKAGKDDVARIALEVFHAWDRRDAIAADILTGAAHSLAKDAAACARRLLPKGGPVQFIFAGGVLLKQSRFARKVARELAARWPEAIVTPLQRTGVEGAVELARAQFPPGSLPTTAGVAPLESWIDRPSSARTRAGAGRRPAGSVPQKAARHDDDSMPGAPADEIRSRAQSPTEQRNPRSLKLDRLSVPAAVELMLSEDARIPDALRAERRGITRAIETIVRSFRKGGRLFYVGAGTSGRLGVLDASECPPTFRTDPEQVQGIIAGGQTALWSAVEGAEDDPAAGARAIVGRGVSARDTVVGIAASGRTPYVWGALDEARRRGASTILVCFNPHLIIPRHRRPNIVLAPSIGPEVLTGSTRLKSGTATKLILNLFTTLAMVRTGKVLSNLMVDVKASNVKLRDRAARIVQELTGLDYDDARAALVRHDWKIPETCAALRSPKERVRTGAGRRRA